MATEEEERIFGQAETGLELLGKGQAPPAGRWGAGISNTKFFVRLQCENLGGNANIQFVAAQSLFLCSSPGTLQ